MLLLVSLLACSGKSTDDTSAETGETAETGESGETAETGESGDSGDSGDTQDTNDTGSSVKLPPDPRPLVLHVTGAYNGTLTFDAPTCSWYDGVPNFRTFWRNGSKEHVFVLIAEIIGAFDGPGTYDQTMGTVRVKLQEEAGGSGYYFGTDTTAGDTVSITVDGVNETAAAGSFTFDELTGDGGAVQVSPQPVPIWCPEMM